MLFRITLAIFLLSFLQGPAEGQTRLRFGPELGVSVSRLPWSREWEDQRGLSRTEETMRLFAGPLVGGQAQLDLGKHWQVALALRYQKTGEAYEELLITDVVELPTDHRHVFHRLSMPLTAGYRFRLAKLPFAVSAGWQPSWFISGKYTRYYIYRKPITSFEPVFEWRTLNLLRGEASWYPEARLRSQLHLELAFFPAERWKVAIGYNTAGQLVYSKFVPSPFDGCDCLFLFPGPREVEYRRHDLSLSMAYFLGRN